MSKQPYYREGATAKDKKKFAQFLAEDEELVLAIGFGKNYLRHKYCYYIFFPGGLGFILTYVVYKYYGMSLGVGLIIGLVVCLILAYIQTVWLYSAHRYLLTTRRVIIKEGVFAVKLITALYDKITHIEVDQGVIDRLVMRHGNVIINTAGGNKDELKLKYVDNPIEFKNLLERLINREREQYSRTTPLVAMEGEVVD